MEIDTKKEECKKQKMDVPILVQVTKGENLIYETIGRKIVDDDNLKALRKSAEEVQKNLNSYLTKLVDEEKKIQPTEKSKDESSDSENISDEEEDEDVNNLLKTISSKKC
ncbi:uncharacterized protein LOC127281080 [Leptopilina boulardi]|uniref:uncharacterized protein LOC127281080 n=1 Tax=Leptopilina boulardi TaxID=63433 RepID=UPI0021F5740C|nr:uncharacterized protein LOC127281080 [Leptopilina boulardi]